MAETMIQADGLVKIYKTKQTEVLALQGLDALGKVADGQATKIIIPSELQNLGGLIPTMKELASEEK